MFYRIFNKIFSIRYVMKIDMSYDRSIRFDFILIKKLKRNEKKKLKSDVQIFVKIVLKIFFNILLKMSMKI